MTEAKVWDNLGGEKAGEGEGEIGWGGEIWLSSSQMLRKLEFYDFASVRFIILLSD